ncbi:hypothetical protein PybrP1_002730 [[Pythium] brassicae (nom. inval.)]|nr:hypothetical protein PybrP1_002730 [[Pythium] brassicae (nom. inval.)]
MRWITFVVADKGVAKRWHRESLRIGGINLKLLCRGQLEDAENPTDVGNVVRDEATLLKCQARLGLLLLRRELELQLVPRECSVLLLCSKLSFGI